jgi:glycerol-3-phosphate cytidylyltransferase-like family protein
MTEILQTKYYNCIVPDNSYEEMSLKKVNDTNVSLIYDNEEYGSLYTEGKAIRIKSEKKLPFQEWMKAYDQSQLKDVEKIIPEKPPEITISINGLNLDYIVAETDWEGKKKDLTSYNAFDEICKKEQFIPTFRIGYGGEDDSKTISIDFGSSIPDSIQVFDEMLDADGNVAYNLTTEKTVKIIDKSRVEFPLMQHFAYMLSSNSATYEMDWLRLFRMVCKWGTRECTYAFLINTGEKEKLTE